MVGVFTWTVRLPAEPAQTDGGEPDGVAPVDGEAVRDAPADGEAVPEALALAEGEAVPEGVALADGEAVPEGVALADGDAPALGEAEGAEDAGTCPYGAVNACSFTLTLLPYSLTTFVAVDMGTEKRHCCPTIWVSGLGPKALSLSCVVKKWMPCWPKAAAYGVRFQGGVGAPASVVFVAQVRSPGRVGRGKPCHSGWASQ
jgi:hypothetical protein